jgi:hypothetical protein
MAGKKSGSRPRAKDYVLEHRIKLFERELGKIKNFSNPYPTDESFLGHCMNAIAKSGGREALGYLRKTLRGAKSDAQARFFLSKLVNYCGSPGVDLLVAEFLDADSASISFPAKGKGQPSNYRVLIATAFMGASSQDAVPALSRHLKSAQSPPQLKILCATALGLIGDEGAMDALEVALKDKDAQVREHSACAIAEIGHPAAIPFFSRESDSMLERNIEYAARNLVKINGPKIIAPFFKLVREDKVKWLSTRTRVKVAAALGNTGDKKAIPVLVRLVEKERSEEVQIAAIYAIGRIGGKEALEALKKLMREGSAGRAANAALYRMTVDDTQKLECVPHPSSVKDLQRGKSLTGRKRKLTSG